MPKSASVLWAVGDANLQEAVVAAHHAAVADVLAFMERELAATRVGVSTGDGAVAQVPVLGLAATAFDHFDSRAGDPHLHTHVVISNKVRAVLDGRWRSLDGRPLRAASVTLPELHEGLFADRLTRLLGVEWEAREQGRERNSAWTIAAVPESLVREFSSRSRGGGSAAPGGRPRAGPAASRPRTALPRPVRPSPRRVSLHAAPESPSGS